MPAKVAITGASGFVGRNLAASLQSQGEEVTAVIRPGKEKVFFEMGAKVREIKDLAVQSVDTVNKISDIFIGQQAVFHMTYVTDWDVRVFEKMNMITNQNVIDAAMRSGVKKFITNSGLGVADLGKKRETTNGYFRMKKRLESDVVKAWRMCGMRYVLFRPSYIVGKGDELTLSIADKIKNGETILVPGNGRYKMQPIFIRDVVDIYSQCLKLDDFDNQTFDLVGPRKIGYSDYIKLIGKFMGIEPKIMYIPKSEALMRLNELGINEDELDVMMCDETGDDRLLRKTFDIELTPLEKAVEKIVESGLSS